MAAYRKKNPTRSRRARKRGVGLTAGIIVVAVTAVVVAAYALSDIGGGRGSQSSGGSVSQSDSIIYNGKVYVPNDHLSNYLFLGVDNDTTLSNDTTTAPSTSGQADAIYLVSYDRAEKAVKIFAIPRDTMCNIESFSIDGTSLGTSKNHLSLQYAYGDGKRKSCELMETAVSNLFYGLRIDGYTTLNLESISHLTELVGYVDVVVPDSTLEDVDPEFQEGRTVRLTADNTETFVRRRDIETSQSALTRMERQKVFIKAFVDRVRELQAQDGSTVTHVYEGLQDYMITNMGSDLFLDLVEATSSNDITTIPGTGTTGDQFDEYEVDEDQLYDLIVQDFYREQSA